MKSLSLSEWDEENFDRMSQNERETFIKACFAYVDVLQSKSGFLRAKPLQNVARAKRLRRRKGKMPIIDGPFAETKELGGVHRLDPSQSQSDRGFRGRRIRAAVLVIALRPPSDGINSADHLRASHKQVDPLSVNG